MGFFKKKTTAAELGEHLAGAAAVITLIPIQEAPVLDFLVENTPLDETSARFEVLCLIAIIFDNAVLANVSSVLRKDVLNSFYHGLKNTVERWTGDADEAEKLLVSRIHKYHEALELGQLASGTPAIGRAFFNVCEGGEEGSIEDFIGFMAHTMALLTTFTEGARKIIREYKLI